MSVPTIHNFTTFSSKLDDKSYAHLAEEVSREYQNLIGRAERLRKDFIDWGHDHQKKSYVELGHVFNLKKSRVCVIKNQPKIV